MALLCPVQGGESALSKFLVQCLGFENIQCRKEILAGWGLYCVFTLVLLALSTLLLPVSQVPKHLCG